MDFTGLDGHLNMPDIIGLIGVMMVLWAYLWLQLDKIDKDSWIFSAANFIGAVLILVSLWHTMNFASFVIEVIWLLISSYGLIKCYRRRK